MSSASASAIPAAASQAIHGNDAIAFLGEREFNLARRLIGEYAGINVSPHKRNMVHNRLVRRLFARLGTRLESPPGPRGPPPPNPPLPIVMPW